MVRCPGMDPHRFRSGDFQRYLAIPIALGFFVLRRRNVPFSFVFWLFVAFILSCGVTHLTEAIIFYRPIYRFAGLAKAVTATISIATVIALVRVMPARSACPTSRPRTIGFATKSRHGNGFRMNSKRRGSSLKVGQASSPSNRIASEPRWSRRG